MPETVQKYRISKILTYRTMVWKDIADTLILNVHYSLSTPTWLLKTSKLHSRILIIITSLYRIAPTKMHVDDFDKRLPEVAWLSPWTDRGIVSNF